MSHLFSQISKNDLVSILSEFYNTDDIVAAKSALFAAANGTCPDDVQLLVVRCGANKHYTDMDDIVTLYAVMDVRKVTWPKFVAINLVRLPSIPASIQVSLPPQAIDQVVPAVHPPLNHSESLLSQSVVGPSQPSWADHAVKLALTASVPFQPSPALQQKLICGKRPSSGPVKVFPCLMTCYAGPLDIYNMAEALQEYLASVGIEMLYAKSWSPKMVKHLKLQPLNFRAIQNVEICCMMRPIGQ